MEGPSITHYGSSALEAAEGEATRKQKERVAMATAFLIAPKDLRERSERLEAENSVLREQIVGLEMRVEELMDAVETVNRAGVLKVRALEARITVLEAVRDAAKGSNDYSLTRAERCVLQAELEDALAAAEEPDEPTHAQS